jgi:hypothetical protein
MSNGLDFIIHEGGIWPKDATPDNFSEGEHLLHNQTLWSILDGAQQDFPILYDAWDCKETVLSADSVTRLLTELESLSSRAPTISKESRRELNNAIDLCRKAQSRGHGIIVSGP